MGVEHLADGGDVAGLETFDLHVAQEALATDGEAEHLTNKSVNADFGFGAGGIQAGARAHQLSEHGLFFGHALGVENVEGGGGIGLLADNNAGPFAHFIGLHHKMSEGIDHERKSGPRRGGGEVLFGGHLHRTFGGGSEVELHPAGDILGDGEVEALLISKVIVDGGDIGAGGFAEHASGGAP